MGNWIAALLFLACWTAARSEKDESNPSGRSYPSYGYAGAPNYGGPNIYVGQQSSPSRPGGLLGFLNGTLFGANPLKESEHAIYAIPPTHTSNTQDKGLLDLLNLSLNLGLLKNQDDASFTIGYPPTQGSSTGFQRHQQPPYAPGWSGYSGNNQQSGQEQRPYLYSNSGTGSGYQNSGFGRSENDQDTSGENGSSSRGLGSYQGSFLSRSGVDEHPSRTQYEYSENERSQTQKTDSRSGNERSLFKRSGPASRLTCNATFLDELRNGSRACDEEDHRASRSLRNLHTELHSGRHRRSDVMFPFGSRQRRHVGLNSREMRSIMQLRLRSPERVRRAPNSRGSRNDTLELSADVFVCTMESMQRRHPELLPINRGCRESTVSGSPTTKRLPATRLDEHSDHEDDEVEEKQAECILAELAKVCPNLKVRVE